MNKENNNKKNLLIGCTGSVATVRITQLIEAFKENYNLKIILTENAKIFADRMIFNYEEYEKENGVKFYFDEDEYKEYRDYDKVLHIEVKIINLLKLRKWADAIIIAPLSANSLAKVTNGLCDNLLTCVIRAWDFSKPGFFALAMNTFMYENFLTERQIKILKEEFKFIHIPSVVKILKCGDVGIGGIADTKDIYDIVDSHLKFVSKQNTNFS